jgi:hypothetical protein
VKAVPALPYYPSTLNAFLGLFSGKPRSVIQTYSHKMSALIKEALKNESYDVMVASEVNMPYLVSQLASEVTGIPKIIDAIEFSLAKDAYNNSETMSQRFY